MGRRERSRVLYVEDDEGLQEIVAAVLASDQLEVTAVGLVGDGLRELERGGYDLVIADYHLPDGNGGGMLRDARDRGLLRDMGAIVLTSEPRPLGLTGLVVLHKPVDCDALLRVVHGLIALRARCESGIRYRGGVEPDLDAAAHYTRGLRFRH